MATTAAALAGATLALVYSALTRLFSVENRLRRIEGKLDALTAHAGIDFDPAADVAEAVSEALKRGAKIEAIKIYRDATGSSLQEAKGSRGNNFTFCCWTFWFLARRQRAGIPQGMSRAQQRSQGAKRPQPYGAGRRMAICGVASRIRTCGYALLDAPGI